MSPFLPFSSDSYAVIGFYYLLCIVRVERDNFHAAPNRYYYIRVIDHSQCLNAAQFIRCILLLVVFRFFDGSIFFFSVFFPSSFVAIKTRSRADALMVRAFGFVLIKAFTKLN